MGKEEIRELSITNALTDAYLILAEVKDLKRSLGQELDFARDRRLSQEKEFREFMSEVWSTLRKIQAQFHIESQLLNLIERPDPVTGKRGRGERRVTTKGVQ